MKPVFFENGIFPKRQKINYRNVPIYKMYQQNDVKQKKEILSYRYATGQKETFKDPLKILQQIHTLELISA